MKDKSLTKPRANWSKPLFTKIPILLNTKLCWRSYHHRFLNQLLGSISDRFSFRRRSLYYLNASIKDFMSNKLTKSSRNKIPCNAQAIAFTWCLTMSSSYRGVNRETRKTWGENQESLKKIILIQTTIFTPSGGDSTLSPTGYNINFFPCKTCLLIGSLITRR